MPDKEKVIKGLERCLICDISVIASEEAQNAYRECEYTVGLYCGEKKLLRETITLLKEQEDTINELQNAYEYLQKQFFEVQDKLLKEQDAVEPIPFFTETGAESPYYVICGHCKSIKSIMLKCTKQKYCHECGKAVKWE